MEYRESNLHLDVNMEKEQNGRGEMGERSVLRRRLGEKLRNIVL